MATKQKIRGKFEILGPCIRNDVHTQKDKYYRCQCNTCGQVKFIRRDNYALGKGVFHKCDEKDVQNYDPKTMKLKPEKTVFDLFMKEKQKMMKRKIKVTRGKTTKKVKSSTENYSCDFLISAQNAKMETQKSLDLLVRQELTSINLLIKEATKKGQYSCYYCAGTVNNLTIPILENSGYMVVQAKNSNSFEIKWSE